MSVSPLPQFGDTNKTNYLNGESGVQFSDVETFKIVCRGV